MIVKITQGRTGLLEGIDFKMGFAFLKKVNENLFETVQPISPCKDYLNDVVYCEKVSTSIIVYGLKYTRIGIFDASGGYLAIRTEKHRNGSTYPNYDQDLKNLKKNYKNIETLLNYIEDRIGIEHTTIQPADNDNIYVLHVPKFWIESTAGISLYALIVRIGQLYDGKTTPIEFLNSVNEGTDGQLWVPAKLRLAALFGGAVIKQKLTKGLGPTIHNKGIISFTEFELT